MSLRWCSMPLEQCCELAEFKVTAAKYTVLGWQVRDIVQVAKDLQKAHVSVERYPGMQQDEVGIWSSPSGATVTWFRDPDGNTLSITQF